MDWHEMAGIDEDTKICKDALDVLLDGAQLCRLLRGESESCSFASVCGELFTKVAMLHLCAQAPQDSVAWKFLKPAMDAGRLDLHEKNLKNESENLSCNGDLDEIVNISPQSDSPLLRSLDANDCDVEESVNRVLKAKDEEILTLHRKLHKLEQQMTELRKVTESSAHELFHDSNHVTAAASLKKHGVPILAAATMDLDFSEGSKISLGRGVFSDVYQTTMKVAVKVITGRFSQERLQQFRQEAETLQIVQGAAGIIRFFGICIDSLPNLYLVTEIADGGSLESLLASKGDISFIRALSLATSIAEAMDHVHQKFVLHRDLKPSNCMLTKYDTIKLIDFGLARILTDEFLSSNKLDGAGTPTYQAPEVLANKEVGFESDVYSFAIIMWELLSRKLPFDELSLEAMRSSIIAGERPPIEDSWDSDWVFIMTQCWDNLPKSRPSFSQIQRDLRKISNTRDLSANLDVSAEISVGGHDSAFLDTTQCEQSPYRAVEEL